MPARATSTGPRLCLLAAFFLASLLGAAMLATPALGERFKPAADAHVKQAHPRENYGDARRLTADHSPVRRAYLRFAVRGLDAGVKSATLKVFSHGRAGQSLRLQPVRDSGWSESTITYRNAPALRRGVDRTKSRADGWVSLDATELVDGNGSVSMAVTTPSSRHSPLSSHEGTKPPRLIVTEREPTQPSSNEPPPPPLRGAASHPLWSSTTVAQYDRELDALRDAGATAIRIDLGWASLEEKGKGNYAGGFVDRVDTFFQHAAAHGLKVIVTFWSTPCWASTAPDSLRQNCAGEWWNRGVNLYPPRNPQDYADAAAWVARRWGRYMAGIQIWNEPNHVPSGGGGLDSSFWRTRNQAGDYAELLKAAYPAIKRAAPNVPVVGGALSKSDGEFLERLYDLGIKGAFDVFSIHPYTDAAGPGRTAEGDDREHSFVSGIPWIRGIMSRHGDAKPLWLTEFGWSTCSGTEPCVSPSTQATFTERAWEILSRYDYVKAATQYNLRERSENPLVVVDHFGLLNRDFTEKPAWASFRAAMRAGG